MRQGFRDIVIAAILLSMGLTIPALILPTVSRLLGVNLFRGVEGISFSIRRTFIPMPIFRTPDSYTFTGFTIAFTLLTAYIFLRQGVMVRALLRKQVAELITVLTSYIRAGTPIVTALELSASIVESPMKEYVLRLSKLIQLGYNPFEAFETVFSDAPMDVRAILSSIPIGVESGGRVAEVLTAAEGFSFQLSRMEELRRARLEGYKAVLVLAILSYLMSSLVTTLLLSYIARMMLGTPLARAAIDLKYVLSLYYISTIITTAITSIATSRIIHGEIATALKYTATLILLATLVFSITTAFI
jgi:hypothetical protein